MARLAGSIIKYNNEVRDLLNTLEGVYDSKSYAADIPRWVDDCLAGAAGQVPGTQRVSAYRLFTLLSYLDEISTETVGNMMNRKRIAIEGKGYSRSYIEFMTKALRCASQAIAHHEKNRTPVIYTKSDLYKTGECPEGYEPATTVVKYTEAQLETIRALAVAGKLDELDAFVNSITK